MLIICHQPHHHTRSTLQAAVLRVVAVADIKLASVSACEHPTTTCGRCGLLEAFRLLVAP